MIQLIVAVLVVFACGLILIAVLLFLYWLWQHLLDAVKTLIDKVIIHPETDEM